MTPKKQLNFRASTLTWDQLRQLQEWWGANQNEVITVAVDRVYREELAKRAQPQDAGGGGQAGEVAE
jgi:hypothetical protein